jgi:hypothetical protein
MESNFFNEIYKFKMLIYLFNWPHGRKFQVPCDVKNALSQSLRKTGNTTVI